MTTHQLVAQCLNLVPEIMTKLVRLRRIRMPHDLREVSLCLGQRRIYLA